MRAVLMVALCTLIAGLIFPYFDAANLSMIYLAGVVITALYYGRGPSVLATILSVATFDFLFTKPYGTLIVANVQYVLTMLVMLLVAITISSLAARTREQTEVAQNREHQIARLYALSRDTSNAQTLPKLFELAAKHIAADFNCMVAILIPNGSGELTAITSQTSDAPPIEIGVAQWAYQQGQAAGWATDNIPGAACAYMPLKVAEKTIGILAMYFPNRTHPISPESRQFLATFLDQIALAIERMRLTQDAEEAQLQAETERLRSSLLSSVSHDLRTPLASITGAASTLYEKGLTLDARTHEELAQVAYEEAMRLNRLVGNLLNMTRLESGGLKVEKEWQTVEEIVGTTLRHIGQRRREHPFTASLPPDLPLVPMDSLLIEQVLVNLLENAIKYTVPGTPIELRASAIDHEVTIEVADRGPGVPAGDEEKIFEKFYRVPGANVGGAGLGLAICKGIIEAHGGHIRAANRSGGGLTFTFTLPLEGEPPEIREDL